MRGSDVTSRRKIDLGTFVDNNFFSYNVLALCNMHPVVRGLERLAYRSKCLRSLAYVGQRRQLRALSSTSPRRGNVNKKEHDIEGYVADLLDAPLYSVQHATRSTPTLPPKESLPMTTKEETLAKARIVFGSKLAGPAERRKEIEVASQMIAGVMVPPRPDEPDNCCMSGCVNCVWDTYRDELEEWAAKSTEARQKTMELKARGQATGSMAQEKGIPAHAAVSMDDDGGGSESNWSTASSVETPGAQDMTDLFADIPVGIREFMKHEKKLKEMHKRDGAAAG